MYEKVHELVWIKLNPILCLYPEYTYKNDIICNKLHYVKWNEIFKRKESIIKQSLYAN
jgi:hypothetical protein